MDHNMILILLIFVFCIRSSSYFLRQFHYVNLKMSWASAQQYCRANYTDLATFNSMEDINRLNRPTLDTTVAWIGLNDDPNCWRGVMGVAANSWRWSATGTTSRTGYEYWSSGEPNDLYLEYCGSMYYNGFWNDISCYSLYNFICYTETAQKKKTYVYVPLQLTWSDARNYCRVHFTDLPTIENSVDNTNVQNMIPSNLAVWIGLYRLPWKWSDNSSSLFKNWLSGQPDNYGDNQYCVGENYQHLWSDEFCQTAYAFVCHEDPKDHMTMVRIQIQTSADMTDPATNEQFLEKLLAVLRSRGLPYILLQWKTEPRKEKEKPTETLYF